MGDIIYNRFKTLDLKLEKPNLLKTIPQLSSLLFPPLLLKVPESIANSSWYKTAKLKSDVNNIEKQWDLFKGEMLKLMENPNLNTGKNISKIGLGNQAIATGIDLATDLLSGIASNKLFGDSELGRGMGTLFSSGLSSAGNTITNNIIKGTTFADGLSKNAGASVAGATAGLAANYIGKGITSAMGDSMLSRGIGQGVATGIGSFGGTVVSNLLKGNSALLGFKGISQSTKAAIDAAKAAGDMSKANDLASAAKFANTANIVGLAGSVVGSGLGAAFGPSKEYGGRYGNITLTMDSVYDTAMVGANFIPGAGQMISGVMALNKGLSNIFGSTDGMTKTDAILGSAFMPAPVKWLNMWGASSTGTFDRQSWLNLLKANSFMGDAFGNLSDKFDLAREEAGKTYGTFSQGAKDEAQKNIDFANAAWGKIMDMANLNEYQNIRSQYMSSINNLRYAQAIQGGWTPLARGKQGMKILNNATNHNMGMRLLSAAALIDNKAMILSAGNGVKIPKLQTAFLPIEKSDNTRVASLHTEQPFTRKQWKEEQLRRNIEQAQRKQTVISSDNRSAYEKLLGQKKATINQLLEQRIKNQEAAIKAFLGLSTMVTPSYWVEQTTGQNLGTAGSLAVDLATPFVLGKGLQLTGKGLLLVGRGTNKLTRFGISPYTGKWTLFGNREYRFKPGYLGINGSPIESRGIVPQITAENAASITPKQWTTAQDAAIARGDMAEALRLRDLHFRVNAPNNKYHGHAYHNTNTQFNEFKPEFIGKTDGGYYGEGFYFTPNKIDANNALGPIQKDVYVYLKNPREIMASDYISGPLINNDGAIVRNGEEGWITLDGTPPPDPKEVMEVVSNIPSRIKLADAVTYDNSGVRIPLGKRDNFNINDVRYGWQGVRYVLDLTTLKGILNFIDNDIIPRMLAQGHNVSSYTPTFRQFSPKTDAFDEAMSKANSGSGAWFTPASNDVTIRGPLEKQDFGLTIHEAGGHGLRYNMLPDYAPTKRDYLNEYIITGGKDMSDEAANALLKMHTGDQIYNAIEAQKLRESYPWIKTYFERNPVKKSGDTVLRESGSVNTQFRSHYSNSGKIIGKELDEVVDKASPGVVLRDLIEQPYTSSIVDDIAKITGEDPDALLFYGPEMLEKLVNSYPKLLEIVSKVKDTMKTVGNYGVPITIGGSTAATLYNTNK